ncbi:MAG TPA: nucleotide disphospho-sugar-binding domain-containing protein [Taishania sp.]|nr:nucleotide disphospho-sugar-binding domain-containing protein [Taishania sp.]
MKTITLLTSGTRGDVIPYLALGKGLQDAGYTVRIAAPIGFANLIHEHKITFSPFEGNPSDLLIEQGNLTPLTLGKNFIHSIQTTKQFLAQARPLYQKMLQTASEACKGSDILIHGLPTLWGAHIAEGLKIPAVRALLQPLAPTNEFASALLPFRFSIKGINWFSHFIVTQIIYLSWRSEINHVRQNLFRLGSAPLLDPSLQPASKQPFTLNAFSEQIVPRPKDWNEKQIITGYWHVQTQEWTAKKELLQFVNSSKNLIAIGFGSPNTKDISQTINILDKALNQTNSQAVLTIPSKWHNLIKSKNIFPIEYVPHEWLYKHAKVAIHHGGAGTTAASFQVGIPTITLPLAIDQFFWGERVYKIGVGPKAIPQRKLTAKKLAHAIQITLSEKTMKARAKNISERLSQENGIQVAVSQIRKII